MQTRTSENLPGIDISHYEDGINYDDIAAQGKKVVYLKASEGSTGTSARDVTLTTHNVACRARGLATGPYHLVHFYPGSTIADQAANVLAAIAGQTFNCPPAIDVEPTSFHGVDADTATAQLIDLAARIGSTVGVAPIVYADTSRIRDNFTDAVNRFLFWIADYRYPNIGPGENARTESWIGFQYSDKGSVGGQTVDLDEFTPAIIVPAWCYGGETQAATPAPTSAPAAPQPDQTVLSHQQVLNRLHIRDFAGNALAEDGVAGDHTDQAIRNLQTVCGISVDGQWGPQTDAAVDAIIAKPMLRRGSTGVAVRYIQSQIGGIGVDGDFGPETEAHVCGWQANNGLSVDGIFGPASWGRMIG